MVGEFGMGRFGAFRVSRGWGEIEVYKIGFSVNYGRKYILEEEFFSLLN